MFLIQPKPFKNETLLSLFFRTAEENRMANPNWILENFQDIFSIKLNPHDINWRLDILKEIAIFLNIPVPTAYDLTILGLLDNLNLKVKSYTKNPWFLYSRVKCCPQCLQGSKYQRKNWVSSHSLLCVEHRCFLIDACSNCDKPLSINSLIKGYCTKCSEQILVSRKIVIKDSLLLYQENLDNILFNEKISYKHSQFHRLDIFLKVIEFLGLWAVHLLNNEDLNYEDLIFDGNVLDVNSLKNTKTITQAICIYSFAFSILDGWPKNFYSFIQLAEITNNKKFRTFIKYTIPSLYNTDLEFIAKEFTNYIAYEKDQRPRYIQYKNTDEIKFISQKFNANIIYSNKVLEYRSNYFGSTISYLDSKEILYLLNKYEDSLTKEKLQSRWGTSVRSTLSILKSDTLEGILNYATGSLETWVIPMVSIIALETKLKLLSNANLTSSITFNKACQWIDPDNSFLLIEGILSKQIGFYMNQAKLADTLISKQDVYSYVKYRLIEDCEVQKKISIRILVFILGVKKADIYHWVKTGRFGAIKEIKDEEIPYTNYLYFSNRYFTTSEYSSLHHLSVKQILKKHSKGLIKSIAGPHLNDGNRLLFEKKK